MAHFQGRWLVFAFLLAWLLLAGTASATIMTVPNPAPVMAPIHPGTMLTAADDAWHSADALALNSSARGMLDYPYAAADSGQTEDLGEVIRHRGFGKALLIIIACGALIRLLTSPAYLKFISDVLDPKAF